MERKLLELTPKRYLCPYCGKWHKWKLWHELGYYDSSNKAKLGCEGYGQREMYIYFDDSYCYYGTVPTCFRGNLDINDKIHIEDIVERTEEHRVTFAVPFTADSDVGINKCSNCKSRTICLMCKLADENKSRHMHITFGFEFEQSDYEEFSKAAILECKEKENKEDNNMANNIFSMNMEFGPNKDENIASTLMGVAVKNGDSWRIYDKKKKEITDIGDMQLGNLPIFILPTTKLSEGDLIKEAGEYYFVTKVAIPNTPTQTISARTGEMRSVVPIKNVLGISCYSKVVALSDSLDMGDDFDVEKLAIMSAMCSQTGEGDGHMNQFLPLMLFKDKIRGDEDMMKLLLMSSVMTSEDEGGQMNQFLPLMLFKDKFGGDDDTMKLLIMSSMMGGNMVGFNNPLMSYLMLDTFMSKKDYKDIQQVDEDIQQVGNIQQVDKDVQQVDEDIQQVGNIQQVDENIQQVGDIQQTDGYHQIGDILQIDDVIE